MSIRLLLAGLSAALLSTLAACTADQETIPTVPGPEAPELDRRLKGYVVLDRPVGGLVAISLKSLEEIILREPGNSSGTVHSVSGPDLEGRVAFVENHMLARRHLLKTLTLDGKDERVLFERRGDALWSHNGDEIGDYLALAPRGGLVAFVEDLERVQMREPSALLARGRLAVWDVVRGVELPIEARALDGQLQWFPGGRKLAYSDLVPRERGLELLRRHVAPDEEFGRDFEAWDRIPVVFVYDLDTNLAVALHVGTQPAVAPDGRGVFVRGLEARWRLYDVEADSSRALRIPGGIWPGAVGFVEPDLLLCWAWPTEGAQARWTGNNSPLVGSKPMRTLKVVELETGRFRTVIPYIDPRRKVSFGPGPAGGE